jgi:hypothetical protein
MKQAMNPCPAMHSLAIFAILSSWMVHGFRSTFVAHCGSAPNVVGNGSRSPHFPWSPLEKKSRRPNQSTAVYFDFGGMNLFGPTISTPKFDASSIIKDLVSTQQCYATQQGVEAFIEACSDNIIYEDCYSSKNPYTGKQVRMPDFRSCISRESIYVSAFREKRNDTFFVL